MKKRAKPRENWENVVEIPREIFKTEDYQAILKELNIPFDDQTIKKILDAQKQYYAGIRIINEGPRPSEICATMKRLIKYGKLYQECLRKLDDKSRERMGVVMPIPFDIWSVFDRSLSDAVIITGRAQYVLEDWEQHKKETAFGAPFDFPLRTYICYLAGIYKEATNKKPSIAKNPYSSSKDNRYNTPFFRMVWACFNNVPGHPHLSNWALGKNIERALANPISSLTT